MKKKKKSDVTYFRALIKLFAVFESDHIWWVVGSCGHVKLIKPQPHSPDKTNLSLEC